MPTSALQPLRRSDMMADARQILMAAHDR